MLACLKNEEGIVINRQFNVLFTDLDGAAVCQEIKESADSEGEISWILPDFNSEYRYAILDTKEELLWASKDGSHYVIAIAIKVAGQTWTGKSLLQHLPIAEVGSHSGRRKK